MKDTRRTKEPRATIPDDPAPVGYFAVDVTRPGVRRLRDFMAKTQRLIDEGTLETEAGQKEANPAS